MNFKNMPELDWGFGYLFAWVIILASTGLIYWWLYRKGWLGDVLRRKNKNERYDPGVSKEIMYTPLDCGRIK